MTTRQIVRDRTCVAGWPGLVALASLASLVGGCGSALDAEGGPGSGEVLARADASYTVWFTPNVGSPDLLQLFTAPDGWPRARRVVGVFKFYGQQLASTEPAQCPTCGDNILPRLAEAGAFDRLAEWGMRAGMEFGAVKPQTCDGQAAAQAAAGVIDLVAG